MENESPPPERAPHPDPEIEALLQFTPVKRHTRRHDGWPPERQRDFIVALAELGSPDRAAHRIGRTGSGAWKVRTSSGAHEFAEAWDRAVALYHRRNPKPVRTGRPSRGEELRWTDDADRAAGGADAQAGDMEEAERLKAQLFDGILRKYQLKLIAERRARLEGRIVEADFYVRQLTYIEVMLDLGGQGMAAHDVLGVWSKLTPQGMLSVEAAATPMSLLLDKVRRHIWREKGEPDRMDLPPLGEQRSGVATGRRRQYTPQDGDRHEWDAARTREQELAAEAQRLWEEKARADAEAWAEREAQS